MRQRHAFSKASRNPYAKRLKTQIAIRLGTVTLDYFKPLAEATGIRYQTLIILYLRDCAAAKTTLGLRWKADSQGPD